MPQKGPHISIESESLVNRILKISSDEFDEWPEGVQKLAIEISEELFLVRYNPFIRPETVRKSVAECFDRSRLGLDLHYANSIAEGITMFWSSHEADVAFRRELISRLSALLPKDDIDLRPASRVENSTDATDLRLELPLLVITPGKAEQLSKIVELANEMQFALIPRGGGSGLTGGAVPARKRSVVLSMTKLNRILEIDEEKLTATIEAGALTIDAINAIAQKNLLFTIDPASKTASTIGGNISENSGGPLAVEYGTTIDNIYSFRIVLPDGKLVEVLRKDHPRVKIEDSDEAVFEVHNAQGELLSRIKLTGRELRKSGLGKDVTNKVLNGLPGVQKEGTDGIILDATFILHPRQQFSRVFVLEFYGRSMHNATLAINDIMNMRPMLRAEGSKVRLTMLEEFNSKYVKAIEYVKKSKKYEGVPISVLIVQLEGNDEELLNSTVAELLQACSRYEGVDVFLARDDKEAELFWEDRHKLSAIAKRTSGFKINEDVVIPLDALPDFALFMEQVNLECMARAYRGALQEVGLLNGVSEEEPEYGSELAFASSLIKGENKEDDLSDDELQLHACLFLSSLKEKFPAYAAKISKIETRMLDGQIIVASHMHAGDGNCHVNIPVNSGDTAMLAAAERTAERVMKKAKELGGEISGEHGVGITKIAFQDEEKIFAMREFKQRVDPRNIFNPAKLTRRELPVRPFTFSFNRLMDDLRQSGLPNKEGLIELLGKVQMCTRCGKCKEVCAMHCPSYGYYFYPRNRNMSLGAVVEAIYYSQVNDGRADSGLLKKLREMSEHCTGCGRCKAVCPVKIDSAEVALNLRAFLEGMGQGGHVVKSMVLNFLATDPAARIPKAARLASIGQRMANRFLPMVPKAIRGRLENPGMSGPGPKIGYLHLHDSIRLEKGSLFVPEGKIKGTVLYFPGCGGSIFFRSIGMASLMLCLKAGWAVVIPERTMCCGFPLLAAGMQEVFTSNMERNRSELLMLVRKSERLGYRVDHVLTSCGSCREGIERHSLPALIASDEARRKKEKMVDMGKPLADGALPSPFEIRVTQMDVMQFLLQELPASDSSLLPASNNSEANGKTKKPDISSFERLIYHAPCHSEWTGVKKNKAAQQYASALSDFGGIDIEISSGCCGESGMGAISSPKIYNRLRSAKIEKLTPQLEQVDALAPVLVGCPSCKIGVSRSLMALNDKRKVLHVLEYLAARIFGPEWWQRSRKLVRESANGKPYRLVNTELMSSLVLGIQDTAEEFDERENQH